MPLTCPLGLNSSPAPHCTGGRAMEPFQQNAPAFCRRQQDGRCPRAVTSQLWSDGRQRGNDKPCAPGVGSGVCARTGRVEAQGGPCEAWYA